MSAVTNMWRQLVERRLWPVAILLVAALAMVPVALGKHPKPEPAAPVLNTGGKSELAETPIVAEASLTGHAKRRRLLGSAKNPFAVPKAVATTTSPASAGTVPPSGAPTTPAVTPPTGGGSTPAGGGTTVPTTPAPKPKVYNLYDLTVRFGDSTTETLGPKSTLERLQPLPSADAPAIIYLGVRADGKTAVFLVDDAVDATGDGNCKPSTATCETIQIRAGETEFFDVKDETGTVTAQYELDVIMIHKGATTSAKKAKSSYAGSVTGRRLLKVREQPGYRLDGATGTIKRRAPVVYGAVAHAAVGLR